MKHLSKFIAGIVLLSGNFIVQAQFRAPGGLPPGFHHALLDALAGIPFFYGTATVQVPNGPDQPPTSLSCNVSGLSGDLRIEVNSFEPGPNVPAAEVAQLKDMRSISILRPDQNRMYMVFPKFRSFVELAYGKSTGTDAVLPAKITKTPLGKDVVADQPCAKSEWNVTEADGEHYDLTIWEASNWNNFPIQVKIGDPATVVNFQDLHLESPNSALFVPPAGYTKYEGIQQIIQSQTEKAPNTNAP
jgi:hypothetical protein